MKIMGKNRPGVKIPLTRILSLFLIDFYIPGPRNTPPTFPHPLIRPSILSFWISHGRFFQIFIQCIYVVYDLLLLLNKLLSACTLKIN